MDVITDLTDAAIVECLSERNRTIKYAVPNLRHRWSKELEPYSDNAVAELYETFSMSDEFGDNDEKFPLWFDML